MSAMNLECEFSRYDVVPYEEKKQYGDDGNGERDAKTACACLLGMWSELGELTSVVKVALLVRWQFALLALHLSDELVKFLSPLICVNANPIELPRFACAE